MRQRVVGVGGIFFKARDGKALQQWYAEHLGVPVDEHGYVGFRWRDGLDASPAAYTVWGPFGADTTYFAPSEREYMVNLVVTDLDAMIGQLESDGIEILGRQDDDAAGRFAWIVDPEGTKIELWEPRARA